MRYQAKPRPEDEALIADLHRLKAEHPRWGYRKIWKLLRNEGLEVNRKRVERLWRQEGLQVVRRPGKKKAPGSTDNACHIRKAKAVNQAWSVDFVQDQTVEGRRLKILTVIDEYSREALAVEVRRKMSHHEVEKVILELVKKRGAPELIRSDNGGEFIARGLQAALGKLDVEVAPVAPGSPWQNGKNERFNGILREELLNREIFYSLDEARVLIERHQRRYNTIRPHGAIGFKTPSEFAEEERVAGRWFSHENRAAD